MYFKIRSEEYGKGEDVYTRSLISRKGEGDGEIKESRYQDSVCIKYINIVTVCKRRVKWNRRNLSL